MKIAHVIVNILFVTLTVNLSFAAEKEVVRRKIAQNAPWGNQATTLTLPQRQHPFLFLTKQDFHAVSARASREPWAQKHLAKIISTADKAVVDPLQIPDKPGEWSQHYVCKTCGISLSQKGSQSECPRCKKEYSGWPYDGVIAGRQHHKLIDDAETLALAWQLTGKPAYADKCRLILLGYADRYTKYPIHDYKGGTMQRGARLFAQTLDEAVRMIPLVWAYDMILDAQVVTPADQKHIEEDLFRPAAKIIRRNDMGVGNWQTWHNAAIAAIGFTLDDKGMVDHAINGQSGINFQLQESILPDGFWYEATASYHFYALQALQWQALAMKSAGMNIYQEPKFLSLYKAPLDYVFPDGRFPAINDSTPFSITDQASYYELAYAWYGLPEFGSVAAAGMRETLEAFLWGKDQQPAVNAAVTSSTIFPGLGSVMLRQNTPGNPMAVHLDYGPHGGAHGHPDKLGIILFANGKDVMPDPGRLAYGAPLHGKWYKTTIAHNTVIVDGTNQNPTSARLVSHDFSGPIQIATAACDTAYTDVSLTRSLALAPEYLLDVVSGASLKDHTWDLAYHVQGKAETDLKLSPVKLPQQQDGYQVLDNVLGASTTSGPWMASFTGSESSDKLSIFQADTVPRNVIFAEGVTGGDVTTCPVVISRQQGIAATWVSLLVPGDPRRIQWQNLRDDQGHTITVKTTTRTDQYYVRNGVIRVNTGQ